MSNDKKFNPDEIASKLEAKAKELRESGLSQENLDMAAGAGCTCCGSSCQNKTDASYSSCDGPYGHTTGTCIRSCIRSSPD